MPIPIMNEFTQFSFSSPEEARTANIISDLALCSIQNKLADAMREKMELAPDTTDLTQFMVQHEFYRGIVCAYQTIIADHKEAVDAASYQEDIE